MKNSKYHEFLANESRYCEERIKRLETQHKNIKQNWNPKSEAELSAMEHKLELEIDAEKNKAEHIAKKLEEESCRPARTGKDDERYCDAMIYKDNAEAKRDVASAEKEYERCDSAAKQESVNCAKNTNNNDAKSASRVADFDKKLAKDKLYDTCKSQERSEYALNQSKSNEKKVNKNYESSISR